MAKNINKLSFWLRVREDWRKNKEDDFLCNASKAFKKVYGLDSNREELHELKRKFIFHPKVAKLIFYHRAENKHDSLFFLRDLRNARRVRTAFINWNIRRLSRKS